MGNVKERDVRNGPGKDGEVRTSEGRQKGKGREKNGWT